MSILKSLIESSHVPLYLDFRTGSLKDLSGTGNHAVSAGNERWVQARGMKGIFCPAGTNIQVPHHASLQLSTPSIVCLVNRIAVGSATNPRLVTKGTSSIEYSIYQIGGGPAIGFQTTATPGGVWAPTNPGSGGRYTSVGVSRTGSKVNFFWNGSLSGEAAGTVASTASTQPLYIGNYGAHATGYHFNGTIFSLVLVNEALSDADMVRLMTELESGPSIVRRPSKHFSLPYPSKTPAEYAAEGIIAAYDSRLDGSTCRDLTGNGNDILEMDNKDVERGGPFTSLIRNDSSVGGRTAGNVAYGGATSLTVSAWMHGKSGATIPLESSPNLNFNIGSWYLIPENGSFRFVVNKTTVSLVFGTAGMAIVPKLMHVVGVFDAAASGNARQRLFVDGVEDSASYSGVIGATPFADFKLHMFARNRTAYAYSGKMGPFDIRTVAMTPAQIRESYLEGAVKCLLDARVHADGSCPVSLATVNSHEIIGWSIDTGANWRVTEEAPANGSAGQRYLVSEGGGTATVPNISIPDTSPYGSWYAKSYTASGGGWIAFHFGSDRPVVTNGYKFQYTNVGNCSLTRAGVTLATSTALTLSAGDHLEVWFTRRLDGLIRVWCKGGTLPDWTLLMQATDATITSCKRAGFGGYSSNDLRNYGIVHYRGEMTPFEAIRAGILEGEIPEPIVWTTTDTTQSWTLAVAAGKPWVVEWGDGTTDWYTGTGANQTITHTYASAGTYTIRQYFTSPLDVTYYNGSGNGITGDIAQLSGLTSLSILNIQSNAAVSGDIASLGTLTKLVGLFATNTAVSGDIASLGTLTKLVQLYAQGTAVSGDIANLGTLTKLAHLFMGATAVSGDIASLPVSLTYLSLSSTVVSGDVASIALHPIINALTLNDTLVSYTAASLPPCPGANIQLQNCAWSTAEVDQFMIDLANGVGAGGSLNIAGTNAARSAASDAAKATLLAAGWTVTVNE